MPNFDPDDIERVIPIAVKVAIADLVLAFANLDSVLGACLILEYGMDLATGSILIENLDIGTKIGRLRRLYQHNRREEDDKIFLRFKKEYEKWREARNTISHARCSGVRKSDPSWVIFSPVRATIGAAGAMQIHLIHVNQMEHDKNWANKWTVFIMDKFCEIADKLPEPEK